MKKVLALIVAMTMLMTLSTGALAIEPAAGPEAPAPAVEEQGAEAQEIIKIVGQLPPEDGIYKGHASVNPGSSSSSGRDVASFDAPLGYQLKEGWSIQSVRFQDGLLSAVYPAAVSGMPAVGVNIPRDRDYGPDDVWSSFHDTLIFTVTDGTQILDYPFPVQMDLYGYAICQLTDEDREMIYLYDHVTLPMGKTTTLTLKISDAAQQMDLPIDRYELEYPSDCMTVKVVKVDDYTFRILLTPTAAAQFTFSYRFYGANSYGIGSSFLMEFGQDGEPPVVDSGAAPAETAPPATDNPANSTKTASALKAGEAVAVKLINGTADLSTDTMDALGGSKGKLTLTNGGMTVVIPGGFGKVNEPGRISYPFDYLGSPRHAAAMLAAVKGEGARSEARKVGGVMDLPATATITLKTKLTGTVHIYRYNEDTERFSLVASPVVKDGTVTFSTRQLGYMLLTTGTV